MDAAALYEISVQIKFYRRKYTHTHRPKKPSGGSMKSLVS